MGHRNSILQRTMGVVARMGLGAERGVELVEAAFVLPILLTILLGTIWMGRAYMVYEAITRSAREGARYEVLPSCATCGNAPVDTPSSSCLSTSSNTFQNYIAPSLSATGLDPNQVTNYCQKTQWLNNGDDPQQCGTVVSFTYPTVLAIPFTSLNVTTINIATQVQMRNENQPVSIAGAAPTCP
jgi:hypothetical protein